MRNLLNLFRNKKLPSFGVFVRAHLTSLILLIVSIGLFLLILPLSQKINFMQNDDWVYYKMVENFLKGKFSLYPISAPTFYTQGLIAALFSLVFSTSKLPILTLIFSVLNFFIFGLIVKQHFKRSWFTTVILSSFLFFNPLHVYSMWGFMTENYFLFFILGAFYFFLNHEQTKSKKDLYFMWAFILLGFLLKQAMLVFPLAIGFHFLLKKHFEQSRIYFLSFVTLYGLYLLLFPKTPEMFEKSLQFNHLIDFSYVYALAYGVLILLCAFLLPLLPILIKKAVKCGDELKVVLFFVLAAILFFGLNKLFLPEKISWGEFPYFENTFERTGFFPRAVDGTKYQFKGIYDLYVYWDLFAKIALSSLISFLLVFKRKYLANIYLLFSIIYLGLMVLADTFYDRYILILVPIFIMFLLSLDIKFDLLDKAFLAAFLAFTIFFSYQFSMDFILVNKYVWSRASELSKAEDIPSNLINTWNKWKYDGLPFSADYIYEFSYDKPEIKRDFDCCYIIVEAKNINYPLNFFKESIVYLYLRR